MSPSETPRPRRRMPPRGFVRIRPGPNQSCEVTIPAPLGRLVGFDRLFRVELVEEGILFRYVEGGEPPALPGWLLGTGGSNDGAV